ncbi:MAG: thiol:disulfide interchange protein DsbA/DsbL [Burkholderiales bacterium]|jgi:thiol:disulfide interchange protein DsbA|nr:thiol:disulfide interchange protein DsbA/DsbL [Burkholderiales bacterium]
MSIARFSWHRFYAVLLLLCVSFSANAALEEGNQYRVIPQKAAVNTEGKIEVLEFFSYGCPHCATLAAPVAAWEKKLPKDVVLVRVPVAWGRPAWEALGRAYYTLDALGAHEVSEKAFDAVQHQNVDLSDEKVFLDWVSKNGIDRKKAQDTYRSFAVAGKIKQGQSLEKDYRVQEVPHFYVDGKYEINMRAFNKEEAFFKGIEEVINKVRQERKK